MSSILDQYRQRFIEATAAQLGISPAEAARYVRPAEPQHGDFSFMCVPVAKQRGVKDVNALAAETAKALSAEGLSFEPAGPYVNARIAAQPFTKEIIDAVRAHGHKWGTSTAGAGKTIVIDYSSPNIAKPIGFHHIRSTAIGHAIANLFRAQGYSVQGINYLGDWGKQFGLVAVGFQEFGDPERKKQMPHLVEVYVKANAKAEGDKAFDDKAREFFRRMESQDADALALWKEFRETSLADFQKVYDRLGIHFEHYEGESRYQGKMEGVIDEISQTIGTKISDGALIVDLPYGKNEPPVLLKKDDGSTLYATRDLAAAIDRYDRFHFERSLYVVATDQSLHFKQFFNVLEKMGRPWAKPGKTMVHVNFGRVHGMSTRKGQITLLTQVLDEAKERALEKVKANIAEGRMQTDDPDGLAEQIGVGAIIFGDLKNKRTTDYEFNWEQVLDFEGGHSGPYLQYAHARACNVLVRGGGVPATYDPALLALPEEQRLVREIARYPVVAREAAEQYEPSLVARYLLDLAAAFSHWYTLGNQDRSARVLVDDNEPLRKARVALTDAVRVTLANGLNLLGLQAPERM